MSVTPVTKTRVLGGSVPKSVLVIDHGCFVFVFKAMQCQRQWRPCGVCCASPGPRPAPVSASPIDVQCLCPVASSGGIPAAVAVPACAYARQKSWHSSRMSKSVIPSAPCQPRKRPADLETSALCSNLPSACPGTCQSMAHQLESLIIMHDLSLRLRHSLKLHS